MKGLKVQDEIKKLGNNFKKILRTGELICALMANYNTNKAQDAGIQACECLKC